MKKYKIALRLAGFGLLVYMTLGCEQPSPPSDEVVVEEEVVSTDVTESAPETPSEETQIKIELGERSPAFPGAKAEFSNLKDGEGLEDNNLSVIVDVENYELGIQTGTARAKEIANSAKGQHVHIILDNDPYFANYEAGKPFNIGELESGAHTLIVFPSRSYHESVKSPGAAEIVNFYVGEEKGDFMLDKSKPTIIYSRPKGTYKGDGAKKIMLDFYLNNVELSPEGYKAKYTVKKKDSDDEAESITISEWKPAFMSGLESGEYVVTLQLLDSEEDLVEGIFNNTKRTITVEAE